jgi:hypothetical protein
MVEICLACSTWCWASPLISSADAHRHSRAAQVDFELVWSVAQRDDRVGQLNCGRPRVGTEAGGDAVGQHPPVLDAGRSMEPPRRIHALIAPADVAAAQR